MTGVCFWEKSNTFAYFAFHCWDCCALRVRSVTFCRIAFELFCLSAIYRNCRVLMRPIYMLSLRMIPFPIYKKCQKLRLSDQLSFFYSFIGDLKSQTFCPCKSHHKSHHRWGNIGKRQHIFRARAIDPKELVNPMAPHPCWHQRPLGGTSNSFTSRETLRRWEEIVRFVKQLVSECHWT